MEVRIKLVEGVTWVASGDSGHGLVIDGSPAIGGRNLGTRPMELVLAGLGGCSAMDVITMLRKQRQEVFDCEIIVSGTRADSIPKVFTEVAMHYRVIGRNLNPRSVERAVTLSKEKYCSVSRMLEASVEITATFECVESP